MTAYIQHHKNLSSWLITAKPGDKCVYYVGALAASINLAREEVKCNVLAMKDTAWDMALKGRVYLFQRKVADGEYEYIALKAKTRLDHLIPCDYLTRHSFDRMRVRNKKLQLPLTEWQKAKERADG